MTATQQGSSFLSGSSTTGGGIFGGGLSSGQAFGTGGLGLGSGLGVTQQTQQQLQMGQLQQQQQTLAQDQMQQQLTALSNSPYGSHLIRNTLQVTLILNFKYFLSNKYIFLS